MTDHQKRPLCSAVGMELTPGTDTTRSSTKGPSALLSGGSMSERRGDLVQLPLPVTLMCLLTSSASPPKYRLGPGLAALCLSAITLRRKASRRSRRCVWRCIDVMVTPPSPSASENQPDELWRQASYWRDITSIRLQCLGIGRHGRPHRQHSEEDIAFISSQIGKNFRATAVTKLDAFLRRAHDRRWKSRRIGRRPALGVRAAYPRVRQNFSGPSQIVVRCHTIPGSRLVAVTTTGRCG